jgi:hypothetical protein
VDSLVTIAVFGIAGAAMMAALAGLLLIAAGRGAGLPVRAAFGAVSAALLLAVPALAAADRLGADPGTGFGGAFAAAFGAVLVVYVVNAAVVPPAARRVAGARGATALPRPSAAVLAGGLLLCAVLGAAGAGLATALS